MGMKTMRRKSPQPEETHVLWVTEEKKKVKVKLKNTHKRRTYKLTQKFESWVSWRIVVIVRPENTRGKKIELCQDNSLDSENISSTPSSFLLLIPDSVPELLTTSQHPLSPYLIPNSCCTVFLGLSPYICSHTSADTAGE